MLLRAVVGETLTTREAIVLREIITLDRVTRARLIDQIWGDDPDGGPLDVNNGLYRIVDALRRKLLPGFDINCLPVSGYALTDANDMEIR